MLRKFTLIFVVTLLGTGLAFVPGLWGPLLLDSLPNLAPIKQWLQGDMLWQGVVFLNESGPLGRPISMLTFLINAAVAGHSPFGYKLVNLLIHVGCAGLIFAFLSRLLRRDPNLGHYAVLVAAAIAVWWTVLPIQVSTVLYAIQRMAQLSTLFMLLGLWAFVVARDRIDAGELRGHYLLWLGIPTCTLLAALSKENGLLLPLLCLGLEFAYFRPLREPVGNGRRNLSVNLFLLLGAIAPVLLGAAHILVKPDFLLGGYINRDFTLIERLLTQTRVLWEYVRQILVPFGPGLGIYHDHIQVSTDLFRPPTTILAIAAWSILLGIAVRLRRVVPALLAGLCIYLIGHVMESSVFSLELVFLHRNYLPAVGVLLAIIGLACALYQRLPPLTANFRRAMPLLLGGLLVTLWATTFTRAWVWQSKTSLIAQELRHHPDSLRTRMNAAIAASQSNQPSAALRQIEEMERISGDFQKPTVLAWKALIYCTVHQPTPPDLLREIENLEPTRIHHYVLEPLSGLVEILESDTCGDFDAQAVAEAMESWLQTIEQSPTNERVWKFRYYLGNMYAATGRGAMGFKLVYQAWIDSGRRFDVGVLAFRLAATLEQYELAQEIFTAIEPARHGPDLQKRRYIGAFEEFLLDPNRTPSDVLPEPQRVLDRKAPDVDT